MLDNHIRTSASPDDINQNINQNRLKLGKAPTSLALVPCFLTVQLAAWANPNQELTRSGLLPDTAPLVASIADNPNRSQAVSREANDAASQTSSTTSRANAKDIDSDVPADSSATRIAAAPPGESGANTVKHPKQILRTGVDITTTTVSPNSRQLAQILNLTPILQKIQDLREKVQHSQQPVTLENLATRQDLNDAVSEATQIIYRCDLEVDFTIAEITAEQNVCQEILSGYINDRDKQVFYANAISFLTNGALWAIGEAFDVPTYKYPRLSIPSGTVSILAGVVPSVASMYALKAVNGKKTTSEVDPNMLARLFNYPINKDTAYPQSVWDFLNSIPPNDKSERKEQLIDRWVSDSNIPNFTDRTSKTQLDVLTASVAHKKGLSIATLNTRLVMLTQLGSEILKMKRLLLELAMVVHGEKHL